MTRLPIFLGGPGDVPVENFIWKFKRLLIFQNAHSSDTKTTGYLSVRLEGGEHIWFKEQNYECARSWDALEAQIEGALQDQGLHHQHRRTSKAFWLIPFVSLKDG
ncbi:hypothetical protein NDA18_006217 [Ustilago nuda]|nr:hypothetical protein NDA18_006217 [Ustilago nuda]